MCLPTLSGVRWISGPTSLRKLSCHSSSVGGEPVSSHAWTTCPPTPQHHTHHTEAARPPVSQWLVLHLPCVQMSNQAVSGTCPGSPLVLMMEKVAFSAAGSSMDLSRALLARVTLVEPWRARRQSTTCDIIMSETNGQRRTSSPAAVQCHARAPPPLPATHRGILTTHVW